jgi:hypothetical protein
MLTTDILLQAAKKLPNPDTYRFSSHTIIIPKGETLDDPWQLRFHIREEFDWRTQATIRIWKPDVYPEDWSDSELNTGWRVA